MTHRWQSKREVTSHTDDWLMTYADMITLLLCFFAIFLTVSTTRKDPSSKAPVQQLAAVIAAIPQAAPPRATLPDAVYGELKKPEAPAQASAPVKAEPVSVPPAPAPLPRFADDLQSRAAADIEQKGDRITTIDMNSAAFFDSGSALLSDAGKSILQEVAGNLTSDRFRGYQVTVEGHTDDTPISTALFPSNWELSTARASAVARFLLDHGIPAQRLRAAGYADTFPKAPNRDASGAAISENQAQNRRVVIKLEKID
jgi:chemotaxis protein MotB